MRTARKLNRGQPDGQVGFWEANNDNAHVFTATVSLGRIVARLDRKCLGQKSVRGSRGRFEAFSISRLEGSRWRGGRVELWGLDGRLVPVKERGRC
jgi:hypothetical protein